MNARPFAAVLLGLSVAGLACSKSEVAPEAPPSAAPTQTSAPASPASEATASKAHLQKAQLGEPAPDFTLTTLDGDKFTLSDHAGKIVVLEWFNPDCPFVKQAHLEGSLKGLAKRHEGVVWVAINSNAKGKQGHDPARNRERREQFGFDYPIALDADGTVGRAYGAEHTPHMYVIDPEGKLVYRGGLDNSSGGDLEDLPEVKNYVDMAIADIAAKRAVREPETKAWGCTVKYSS